MQCQGVWQRARPPLTARVCVVHVYASRPVHDACSLLPYQAERLPREQLLKYRTSDGSVAEATNATEWSMRWNEILQAMQQVMGRSLATRSAVLWT